MNPGALKDIYDDKLIQSTAYALNNPDQFNPEYVSIARDVALKIGKIITGSSLDVYIQNDDRAAVSAIGGPIDPEYSTTNINPRKNNRRAK